MRPAADPDALSPQPQTAQAEAVVAAMRSGAPASAELVNLYYTLCIPFYREFLGEHCTR